MRWYLTGSLLSSLSLKAAILGAWEPDYTGENGTGRYGGHINIPGNYYHSFDRRELTLEYKPSYSNPIRFGCQITNRGRSHFGSCGGPVQPWGFPSSSGVHQPGRNLHALWMFRGIHDFMNLNSRFEWIATPIRQAGRYEHSQNMTSSGTRFGDGKT
jgi:hypothetical protein